MSLINIKKAPSKGRGLVEKLSFRELEALTSTRTTGLITLLLTGVASKHAGSLQDWARLRVLNDERTGDPEANGSCLSANSTAMSAEEEIKGLTVVGEGQRKHHLVLKCQSGEIFLERTLVDNDFTIAFAKVDAGDGSFTTTGGWFLERAHELGLELRN